MRRHDKKRSGSRVRYHRYAVGLRRDIERFLHLARGQGTSGSIGAIPGELINDIQLEPAIDPVSGGIDENDSAIVRLTNHVIAEADRLGAPDIHIEPYADRKDVAVRLLHLNDAVCNGGQKLYRPCAENCRSTSRKMAESIPFHWGDGLSNQEVR